MEGLLSVRVTIDRAEPTARNIEDIARWAAAAGAVLDDLRPR
jgi:hypothetical protein